MRSEARLAPFTQLRERHCVVGTAAQIDDARVIRIAGFKLLFQERQQVPRMETIAALVSGPIESDVPQGPLPQVGVDPERKNALLGMTELAGTGEHAATIDPNGKFKRLPVFEGDAFRAKLGGPVERYG